MTNRYSESYIDRQIDSNDYDSLVELQRLIEGSRLYSREQPDYGLPMPAFVFVEALGWFAQSVRSGTWTYFEATSDSRQNLMCQALKDLGPSGFADAYSKGMRAWKDEAVMAELDAWVEQADGQAMVWLREVARKHREMIMDLSA